MRPLIDTRITAFIVVALLAASAAACNRRSPLPSQDFTAPSPLAQTPIGLFGITFNPRAFLGDASGTGTAILTRQAPEGGLAVTLSSSVPSVVSVPAAVTVPAGADRVSFPIAVHAGSVDPQVSITGSAAGASTTAPISVWALVPTFFAWFSDPDNVVGQSGFGHFTPANASFLVSGDTGLVHVILNGGPGEFWLLDFSAPRGMQLRVGSYEGAVEGRDATRPSLGISGRSIGCTTVGGRFQVHDIAFGATGVANRFDATFEQLCRDLTTTAIRGELRLNGGAR